MDQSRYGYTIVDDEQRLRDMTCIHWKYYDPRVNGVCKKKMFTSSHRLASISIKSLLQSYSY